MITIRQPALALNSSDFGRADHYNMTSNQFVERTRDMAWIRDRILYHAAGERLEALIINAHGWVCDGILIGTGLNADTLPIFNAGNVLTNKIGKIYLVGCGVADTIGGAEFCRQLAMQLNADVIASESTQTATSDDRMLFVGIPWYHIDEFEGTVYCWTPSGSRLNFATPLSPHIPSHGLGRSGGRR